MECWSQYLKVSVSNRFDLKCCGTQCPFKITESVFRKLIALHSTDLQNSFQKFLSNVIQPVSNLVELFSSGLANPPSYVKRLATASSADFYHYNCCSEEDNCWGCAYRDLQCIISNYILKGIIKAEIPSLVHIQAAMDTVGHRAPKKFLGSEHREAWIEPPDAAIILKTLFDIDGFQRKFEFEDPLQVKEVKNQLWGHFQEHRTPVMFDDAVVAYNLLGIRETIDGQIQVLRFDPHTSENWTFQHFSDEVNSGTQGIGSTSENNQSCLKFVGWIPFEEVFKSKYANNWMMFFPYAK